MPAPAEPGIDTGFLDELLEGDKEFAEELFDTFFDSAASCLEQARSLVSAGDIESAFRPFHTLKGASASVGLNSVKELASNLEQRARQGDLAGCSDELPALSSAVERGRDLLQGYLASLT